MGFGFAKMEGLARCASPSCPRGASRFGKQAWYVKSYWNDIRSDPIVRQTKEALR